MNKFIAVVSNRPLLFERIVQHLHDLKIQFVPIVPSAILFEHQGDALSAYKVLAIATDQSATCSGPKGQIVVIQILSDFRTDPSIAEDSRLNQFFVP